MNIIKYINIIYGGIHMKKIIILFFIILSCISCVTFNKKNPYQNMKTIQYGNNFAYEFKSLESSNKLLVVLEGSGWDSSLGKYVNNQWEFTEIGAQLIQVLRKNHTILIPEKFGRKPGIDYFDNMEARYIYTEENLVDCYVTVIDEYLNENLHSSVVLVGTSEGAMLLPLICEKINNSELVKGMVAIAFGGLSIYESYQICIGKDGISDDWKDVYSYAIELGKNINEYAESIETNSYGVVYRWMASFMNIRPFDYYKNINIPILFIHGKKDWNMAVESTEYIQKNLPEKPFDYIYYKNMGHILIKYNETIRLRNDIKEWINKNNL
jgi:esterase/lipase